MFKRKTYGFTQYGNLKFNKFYLNLLNFNKKYFIKINEGKIRTNY